MTTLINFLLAVSGSLASRVLLSLGFGFVSYAALSTAATAVVNSVQSNYQMLDPAILSVLNIAGAGQALGIICGGMTASAAMAAFKRLRPL